MAPTSKLFQAARPLVSSSPNAFARPAFARGAGFRQSAARRPNFGHSFSSAGGGSAGSRRWQSTTAEAARDGWLRRLWDSPVGVKTVHFWAPVMKWAIVLAGISDFARPAEKLSLTQNFALTCTGLIWTRWCLIIKPKNYLLAAVNFFLGLVGLAQLGRIYLHEQSKKSLPAIAADAKEDAKKQVGNLKP